MLTSVHLAEPSAKIQERVEQARAVQKERFSGEKETATLCNGEMTIPQIKKFCTVPKDAEAILAKAVDKDRLSARGYHKVLKLSRTIADLDSREKISTQDVLGAIKFNAAGGD